MIGDVHENKFKVPTVNIKICVTKKKHQAKARNISVKKNEKNKTLTSIKVLLFSKLLILSKN